MEATLEMKNLGKRTGSTNTSITKRIRKAVIYYKKPTEHQIDWTRKEKILPITY